MGKFNEYCKSDGLEELMNAQEMNNKIHSILGNQIEFISDTIFLDKKIEKIRFLVEVIFPIGLALYAIHSAIQFFL